MLFFFRDLIELLNITKLSSIIIGPEKILSQQP